MKKRFRRPRPLAVIKLGPYPFDIVLFNDRAKFDAYREWSLGKRLGENALSKPSECNARTCYLDGGHVLAIGVFTKSYQAMIRELCHAIISAFDDMQLQLNFVSSEAFTYLLDHMARECSRYLWPKRKRRGK
jgi:hypothetical protein